MKARRWIRPTATLVGLLASLSLRLTTSGSLPDGLYFLRSGVQNLAAGDLVLVCPPADAARLGHARGYLEAGSCAGGSEELGKIVLAAEGDAVELTPSGLEVNGRAVPSSAPLPWDSRGRPLGRFPYGLYRVPKGQVWLFSPHRRSFDSRYFGPLATGQVRGRLVPLLLHRAPAAMPRGFRVVAFSSHVS